MQDYKRGSHAEWDCKYHVVWTTKYRYEILAGDVGQRCRELLREIARSKEMVIYAGSINRDHVHMLIGIPPNLSVSRAVQYLKGKSSQKLLSEYQHLKKKYWGHIWTVPHCKDRVWSITKEKLHTYIRPLLEAGKLPALMEFAAHFRPHQFNGLVGPCPRQVCGNAAICLCCHHSLNPRNYFETLFSFL